MVNTSFPSISKNGGVFLGSLLFAFLLWFLFYFSRDFTKAISLPVQLLPGFGSNNTKERRVYLIQVKVHGRGWLITQYEKNKEIEPLIIRGEFPNRGYLKLKPYLVQINKSLPAGLQVEEILTDSVLLHKIQDAKKKVPLRMGFQINFQKQYYFSNPTRIYPDSVIISGPEASIRNLNAWIMPNIQFSQINKSLDTSILLFQNSRPEISINPSLAQIEVHVDRFTESSISLPVKIINNSEGRTITLIPARVEISYLVPLSYYSSVREELFEVQVDLNEWKRNPRVGQLKIKLVRTPDFIRIIHVNPNIENFIIYQ